MCNGGLHKKHRCLAVDGHDKVEVGRCLLLKTARPHRASIVDEHIESAELFNGKIHDFMNAFGF